MPFVCSLDVRIGRHLTIIKLEWIIDCVSWQLSFASALHVCGTLLSPLSGWFFEFISRFVGWLLRASLLPVTPSFDYSLSLGWRLRRTRSIWKFETFRPNKAANKICEYFLILFVYLFVVSVGFGVRHGSWSSSCFLCCASLSSGALTKNAYITSTSGAHLSQAKIRLRFHFFSLLIFSLSLSTTSENQHSFASYFWASVGDICWEACASLRSSCPKFHRKFANTQWKRADDCRRRCWMAFTMKI